jgi:hypothetical protein
MHWSVLQNGPTAIVSSTIYAGMAEVQNGKQVRVLLNLLLNEAAVKKLQ